MPASSTGKLKAAASAITAASSLRAGVVLEKQRQEQQQQKEQEQQQQQPSLHDRAEAALRRCEDLEQQVRQRKREKGAAFLSKDPDAAALVGSLQSAAKEYVLLRFGPGPHHVFMTLQFPDSMPSPDKPGSPGSEQQLSGGREAVLEIEVAPVEVVPYSAFLFLEVARRWVGGAFHRRAGHVLQVTKNTNNTHSTRSRPNYMYFPE